MTVLVIVGKSFVKISKLLRFFGYWKFNSVGVGMRVLFIIGKSFIESSELLRFFGYQQFIVIGVGMGVLVIVGKSFVESSKLLRLFRYRQLVIVSIDLRSLAVDVDKRARNLVAGSMVEENVRILVLRICELMSIQLGFTQPTC